MNFLTSQGGKPYNRFYPQPVADALTSTNSTSVTGETVTFKAGAAGTKGIASLAKNRLTNVLGDKKGSFWGEEQNVILASTPTIYRISAITETAASAAVTIVDVQDKASINNLKVLFEITSGNSQYVIELIDPSGNTLYGYIRGITKTGASYAFVVNDTLAGGTQSWKGDTTAFISTTATACAFRICSYESPISFTTGTILLQEKPYLPDITDLANLNSLTTDGDYCVDYFGGRILYRKATTGTSDTIAYTVHSGSGGGTQYAEDAPHTSGDLGFMFLAVRNDAGTALAGTTGDYIPLTTDSTGALRVSGGSTQYTEDAASAGGESLTLLGAVRQDTIASSTSTDGDYTYLKTNSNSALYVAEVGAAQSEDNTNGVIATAMKPLTVSTYDWSKFKDLGANATLNVKASAGNVYSLYCHNINAAARYIQLHNTATTPAGGATPIYTFLVPAGGTIVIDGMFFGQNGANFTTGIAFAFSTTETTYTAGTNTDQVTIIQYK